ncbi:hypothetical protein A2856_00975 [Candidatus Uhrbacteria bacterium RIFCSPHIGHO2_01_FULL_63_20]|uniref:Uncharacterized protein n=1 Tax=Candidatus Uhrbacteria bacterium RIFCSPHIGHO2_01_FULL_63_20 TaxID=1802385 RepID=A0A1F7TM26_9BACT|nr:MAG: hypothetical protein A2856_00975 [Candidatus Uhrbacteria bacterium RIFCSPHIGHO2_01_FULL_63_20]
MSMALLALAWAVSGAWFARDSVSAAAPDGTTAMLRFEPRRRSWPLIERALGDIPLVSNRPMTIRDIEPFIQGEFAVFIGPDSHRSVAIRTQERLIPPGLLDSFGMTMQRVKPGVFHLSDRLESVHGMGRGRGWSMPAAVWSGKKKLGVAVFNDGTRATIYGNDRFLELRLPDTNLPTMDPTGGEAILAALATPLLPNTDISWISIPFNAIAVPFDGPDAQTITNWVSGIGSVILGHDGAFLFAINKENFGEDEPKDVIRLAAALQSPKAQTWELPDKSRAMEIVADPSRMTVQSSVLSGHELLTVPMDDGRSMHALTSVDTLLIGNDRSLIQSWIDKAGRNRKDPCLGNFLFARLPELLAAADAVQDGYRPTLLTDVSRQFRSVGMNNGWMHTSVTLCY